MGNQPIFESNIIKIETFHQCVRQIRSAWVKNIWDVGSYRGGDWVWQPASRSKFPAGSAAKTRSQWIHNTN